MKPSKTNPLFAKRVFWAVDAFHENPKEQLRVAKTIRLLFGRKLAEIQPVSVLRMGQYDPEGLNFPEKWRDLAAAAKKNLEKLLKGAKASGLESPRLIPQEGVSVKNAVSALVDFALHEEADLITVSSHARSGPQRLFIGSFAETLVLHSPLPVLVINPSWQPKKKLKHILFPTDFSETSRVAFERVCLLARELGCEVLLFHKFQILQPDFGYPFVVPPVSKESLSEITKGLHKKGEDWAAHAETLGVKVKFYLAGKPGYALDEILKIAKRSGSSAMIAMASQSGTLASVLLGSLTRQVLRSAPCPVLTIHPHQETIVAKAVEQVKQTAITYASHPLFS